MTLCYSSSKLMEPSGKVRCSDARYQSLSSGSIRMPTSSYVPMEMASYWLRSPVDKQKPVKSIIRLNFEILAHYTSQEPQFPYLQNEL